MAMRLGTISPKAMEKKLMTMVMTTIEMTPNMLAGSGVPRLTRKSVR